MSVLAILGAGILINYQYSPCVIPLCIYIYIYIYSAMNTIYPYIYMYNMVLWCMQT